MKPRRRPYQHENHPAPRTRREFMAQGVGASEQAQFTEAVLRGRPVGSDAFLKPLATEHAAVVTRRPRGRPRKTNA